MLGQLKCSLRADQNLACGAVGKKTKDESCEGREAALATSDARMWAIVAIASFVLRFKRQLETTGQRTTRRVAFWKSSFQPAVPPTARYEGATIQVRHPTRQIVYPTSCAYSQRTQLCGAVQRCCARGLASADTLHSINTVPERCATSRNSRQSLANLRAGKGRRRPGERPADWATKAMAVSPCRRCIVEGIDLLLDGCSGFEVRETVRLQDPVDGYVFFSPRAGLFKSTQTRLPNRRRKRLRRDGRRSTMIRKHCWGLNRFREAKEEMRIAKFAARVLGKPSQW